VVDEEFECPICWTTLTYEPNCDGKEHFVLNKFYVRYLLRQSWFSLLCFVITVVLMCFVDFSWHPACVMPYVGAVVSVLMGMFQRQLVKLIQWKYNPDYANFSVVYGKYIVAVLSVFTAGLLALSNIL
jgi:hypothetical protein